MTIKTISNPVQNAFSRSALSYDDLSALQDNVGRELLKQIPEDRTYSSILDIGMGTGRLTHQLARLFPASRVAGMDFAPGMIQEARKKYASFQSLMADASALPFQSQSFDLVVSNLAYQWLGDLPSAFFQNHLCLKNGGVFCGTVFGRETLRELSESFQKTFNDADRSSLVPGPSDQDLWRSLPHKEDYARAVAKAGFSQIQIQTKILYEHFPDVMALIQWLKNVGANHRNRNFYLGKDRLSAANDYYQKHFRDPRGIYASFETLWITAIK